MNKKYTVVEVLVERCTPPNKEFNDWMISAKRNGGYPKVRGKCRRWVYWK